MDRITTKAAHVAQSRKRLHHIPAKNTEQVVADAPFLMEVIQERDFLSGVKKVNQLPFLHTFSNTVRNAASEINKTLMINLGKISDL